MEDASSLRKKNAVVDRMKDDDNDILLFMKDAGFDRMRDESGIFFKDSRINDELFIEVEDEVIRHCSDEIDIPCAEVWICCKDNSEREKIVIETSLSRIEDEDI